MRPTSQDVIACTTRAAFAAAHGDLQANILDAEWEEFFGEGRWIDDLDGYPETPKCGSAAS